MNERFEHRLVELILAFSLLACSFLLGFFLHENLPRTGNSSPTSPAESELSLEELQEEVSALRQLPWREKLSAEYLDEGRLREKLKRSLEEEAAQKDLIASEQVLKFLNLIPEEASLSQLLLNLYEGEILGFYDPAEKKLFIVGRNDNVPITRRLTAIHEMIHALQDQAFNLERFTTASFEGDDDQTIAIQALYEGDASLGTLLYLAERGTLGTSLSLALESVGTSSAQLESTPLYLNASLIFPYEEGLVFAQSIYKAGGWASINQAYLDPPRSSEEVIHPEKFLQKNDPPLDIEIPSLSDELEDWHLIRNNVLGEFDFRTIFRTSLPKEQADQAAEGWGGCRYQLYALGEARVFILNAIWDSAEDAQEAASAIDDFLKSRYHSAPVPYYHGSLYLGEDEAAILIPYGRSTQLVISPEQDLALALIKKLP